ncbi:MAG: NADH-quinone oxidoreductase subunit J [Chloroflexi bacterium]|nr:NADH-quinone oxidoreductase subunit J [Chloroflexota bacterium]
MTPSLIALAFLAALALGGGLGVVISRNVVYAALFLLVSLGAVAGLYLLLLTEFLALVQVLIYGGAVVIVIVFALMLTRLQDFAKTRDHHQWPLGLAAALAVLGLLAATFVVFQPAVHPLQSTGIQELGNELFVRWALPFEIASLVLLVALIGALIISRADRGE